VANGPSWRAILVAVIALTVAGCAAKTVAPVAPSAPRHPELLALHVPENTAPEHAALIDTAWRHLQADNLRHAETTFKEVLRRYPGFHPAETGLGYVNRLETKAKEAVLHFDRALMRATDYVPALHGRGEALLELNRDGDALASFEAALKADPSLTDLKGRIEVLRFRAVQDNLARAKAATEAARWDEARAAYLQALAASPESAFLYRDLGIVERKAGDPASALEHLRKAVAIDANDARAYAQIGAILEEQSDVAGALEAYEKAEAIDPSEVAGVLSALRERAALASLPAEYRAIGDSDNVTRAELAALIGVRLSDILALAPLRQVVITDVRRNWAQAWIANVVRAGLMDTQPNYTFEPAARMRRGDVARAVARVLALIAAQRPSRAKIWQDTVPNIADVHPDHLSYAAVSQAVASGVMPLDNGLFELLRPVSGAEAVAIVARLEALAEP
jgi:tetratricopeptide (TPR) repeat protein